MYRYQGSFVPAVSNTRTCALHLHVCFNPSRPYNASILALLYLLVQHRYYLQLDGRFVCSKMAAKDLDGCKLAEGFPPSTQDLPKAHTRTLHEIPGTDRRVMECDDKVGRLFSRRQPNVHCSFFLINHACLHATVGYRLIGDLGCM